MADIDSKNNGNINWDQLDPELQQLLLFAQHMKKIQLDPGNYSVSLHIEPDPTNHPENVIVKGDLKNYLEQIKFVKSEENKETIIFQYQEDFLRKIFSDLFYSHKEFWTFFELQALFLKLSKIKKIIPRKTLPPSKQEKKIEKKDLSKLKPHRSIFFLKQITI
jgi:hypothetical protein